MSNARPWVLVAGVVMTAALAYMARDAVQEFVVLPLAYVLWQLRGLSAGVAQLIQWGLLILAMSLVMAWQLIPQLRPQIRRAPRFLHRGGPVNSTAITLSRARSSNYFRWQLAHRLGRAAAELGSSASTGPWGPSAPAAIAGYLHAGLNQSFVDYASRRLPFTKPSAGALGVDPEEVVRYLEASLIQGGGHAERC
jgi:hypothetical protein